MEKPLEKDIWSWNELVHSKKFEDIYSEGVYLQWIISQRMQMNPKKIFALSVTQFDVTTGSQLMLNRIFRLKVILFISIKREICNLQN
ncbi:unnamed protein product [Paramecium pentaurelia]|uniref:Uncharacterized protein n=1 Tax=Paramecium pentaurelia TaxID=43138 RepID=A0A8S1S7E4_9CILI|nr:unnamed protein product [Paramecium pentaurelia]